MANVCIIGMGEIGRALRYLLEKKQHHVSTWDRKSGSSLAEAIRGTQCIFVCIPTEALSQICQQLTPHLRSEHMIVTLAKGLELTTQRSVDHILHDTLPPHQSWGILAGPMLAEELLADKGGAAMLGTTSPLLFTVVSSLFRHEDLLLTACTDPHSLAWSSVLKNVYALAVGVADGLHWGSNRKGQLMTQALTEMQLIFAYLRCDTKVLLSNAGMGDFLATSLSPFSKNHELGVKVVRGEQCEGSEGACALQTLISPPLQSILPTLPLLTQLIAIFEKGVPAERAFRQIF